MSTSLRILRRRAIQPSNRKSNIKVPYGLDNPTAGNMNSLQTSQLPTILNEAPTSADCQGLLYSWTLAQNYINYYNPGNSSASGHAPAYSIDVQDRDANPTTAEFFFNATGSLPSVSSSRKWYLQSLGTWNSPSGKRNYFWTITDAKLLNPPYPSFY